MERFHLHKIIYRLDLSDAVKSFVSNYDKKVKKYLDSNTIIEIMELNDCKNLRTLKVALNYFVFLFDKIEGYIKNKYSEKKEIYYDLILKNVLFITIGQKNGIYIPDVLKGALCTTVSLDKDLKSYKNFFTAFSFVNDYISSGYFDEDLMKKSIDYFNEMNYEIVDDSDPYNIIDVYWEKESFELKKALLDLKERIKDNKYNCKIFPKILSRLSSLINIGFEVDIINQIIDEMKKCLKSSNVTFLDFHSFLDDQEVVKIYNKIVDDFQNILSERKVDEYKTTSEVILDDENWGVALNGFVCDKNTNGILINERGFLAKFDIYKIVENLRKSNNKNIFSFKYAIDKVYNFSNLNEYFKSDEVNLKILIEKLNEFKDDDDQMKKFAYNYLYDDLVKKLELISK